MNTSEILNRAADLIQSHGWWNNTTGGEGLCASNAICKVSGQSIHPAHDALISHLGHDRQHTTAAAIFEWNDAPERTAGEVIEVLRACALIESAKEAQEAQESAWATYADNLAAVQS